VATTGPKPTSKQLSYLRALADLTGSTFTPPTTRAQASREIERLKALPTSSASERRRDRRAVQDAMARDVPASSVRAHETRGYGSTARWAGADPEA
jgi:Protein of unknown function (DUF3072)